MMNANPEYRDRVEGQFDIRSIKCWFDLAQPDEVLHADMDLLSGLNINTVDFCYSDRRLFYNDDEPLETDNLFTHEQIASALERLQARAIEAIAQVRPSVNGRFLAVSDDAMMQAYLDKLDGLYDLGFRALAVCSDDLYSKQDRFEPEADMTAFRNIAEAHSRMMNRVCDHFARKRDPVRIVFCPHVYVLRGRSKSVADGVIPRIAGMKGTDYLRDIGRDIPKEVLIYWTGNYGRPHTITAADADTWAEMIGRPPLLWHNSSRCYGCQPLDGLSPDLGEHVTGYMLNGRFPRIAYVGARRINLFSVLAAMTAADYMWNPYGYEPEASYAVALSRLSDRIPPEVHELVTGFRKANLLHKFYFDSMYVNEAMDISDQEVNEWVAATRKLPGLLRRIEQETDNPDLRESAREFAGALLKCVRSGRILHDLFKSDKALPPDYPKELIANPLPRPDNLDRLIGELQAAVLDME